MKSEMPRYIGGPVDPTGDLTATASTTSEMPRCCGTCKHWRGQSDQTWNDTCRLLSERVSEYHSIELMCGSDGASVDSFETAPNFGCTLHEARDEK